MINYEIKGGLFSAELVEDLASRQGQTPDDFGLASGIRVSDEASRAMSMARNQWLNFQQSVERLHTEQTGVSETRNLWIIPLLSFLGYELQYIRSKTVGDTTFRISHHDGNKDGFPVHIAGFRQSLDDNPDKVGGNRESVHMQMQEYLNHTEHLYGIITNGYKLRLLRDHHRLTGIQYLEWDLEQLMTENDLASFTMLYRILHVSRIPKRQGEDSLLEQYHQHSVEEGHRVREKLKAAVYKSLELLGNGFLKHSENKALREEIEAKKVSAIAYGQQLRSLVYRLLFLLVAEDRQLVFRQQSDQLQRQLYRQHYSLNRLRNLAEAFLSSNPRHSDVWEQLKATFRLFEEEGTGEPLGIAPLGGELFAPEALSILKEAKISNRLFLKALDLLSRFEHEKGHRIRINYRRINVEEFGAVYESLLELNPEIDLGVVERPFQYIDGESRKGTGSFYTHQDLVKQLLKTALEPVVTERLTEAEKGLSDPEERKRRKADALLKIKVCDPACGSGHFLVAAARALATELAYLRAPRGASIDQYEKPALREVIEKCIYGVDVNPDAAELCRLVLWMEAHEAGKPITYLDDKIRCGNSLVGWIGNKEEPVIPNAAFVALPGDSKSLVRSCLATNSRAVVQSQHEMSFAENETKVAIQKDQYQQIASQQVVTLEDYWRKKQAYQEWKDSPEQSKKRLIYNLWTFAFFQTYVSADDPIVTQRELNQLNDKNYQLSPALLKTVELEAKAARFFHWPLEFPEVFENGGFDVLLGNPPWAQIMLKEKQFFAGRKPEIVKARNAAERKKLIAALAPEDPDGMAFHAAKRYANGLGRFLRASGNYALTCSRRINTYSVFSERLLYLIASRGRGGTIVPTGIATDYTNRHFFAHLVEEKRLASLFDFENRDALFPEVDSRFKCCLLTLAGKDSGAELEAQFGFYLHRVSDLSDPQRVFELAAEDFLRINPNTKNCPVLRTREDAKIVKQIYSQFPVLDAEGDSPWDIQFVSMFNISSDADQFQLRFDWFGIGDESKKMRLYEAKMFWHYNHRYNTFTDYRDREGAVHRFEEKELKDPKNLTQSFYELSPTIVKKRMELVLSGYDINWYLGFRTISATTNERTFVNAVLPEAAFSNSCVLIRNSQSNLLKCGFVANLSSIVFDFVCRQKISGNNVSLFVVKQLPIIPPDHFSETDLQFLVPRVLELTYTAWDLQAFANDVWKDADLELRTLIKARWEYNRDFISFSKEVEAGFAWPQGCEPKADDFPYPPFRWDSAHRHRVQCELDAFFFHKYGFDAKEDDAKKPEERAVEVVKYILDPELSLLAGETEEARKNFPGETFRVLKDKEIRKYGEFLTARLVLEAWHDKPWERPQELADTEEPKAKGRRRTHFAKARTMAPVMARIIQRYERPRYKKELGRTKMEKLLHLIETDTGLDFGRAPKKHHYGPADLDALDEAIKVGQQQAAFQELLLPARGNERKSRSYEKGEQLGTMLRYCETQFAGHLAQIDRIIDLFAPLNSKETELIVTLYAEWNNRLIIGEPTDDVSLMEGAQQWSEEKQRKFSPEDFTAPLQWLREHGLVPKGSGKLVEEI
jgi:hypothetical protein